MQGFAAHVTPLGPALLRAGTPASDSDGFLRMVAAAALAHGRAFIQNGSDDPAEFDITERGMRVLPARGYSEIVRCF